MSERPDICIKFSRFVKEKRAHNKLKIKEVIKNSGLSRASIYLIESGGTSPSIDSASRLLTGLGESWESFVAYSRLVA